MAVEASKDYPADEIIKAMRIMESGNDDHIRVEIEYLGEIDCYNSPLIEEGDDGEKGQG